jgi:hypothetical protein
MTLCAVDHNSLDLDGTLAIREIEELYECDGAEENWNCP